MSPEPGGGVRSERQWVGGTPVQTRTSSRQAVPYCAAVWGKPTQGQGHGQWAATAPGRGVVEARGGKPSRTKGGQPGKLGRRPKEEGLPGGTEQQAGSLGEWLHRCRGLHTAVTGEV